MLHYSIIKKELNYSNRLLTNTVSMDCTRLSPTYTRCDGRQPQRGVFFGGGRVVQTVRRDCSASRACDCLAASPRMLTGCHSAFPSDLVHVLRLPPGTATPVVELRRTGGVSPGGWEGEMLSHSRTFANTRTHTHTMRIRLGKISRSLGLICILPFTASVCSPNVFPRCFT